jgi:AICAR transformylase/IMP cyclohydrolase PurH
MNAEVEFVPNVIQIACLNGQVRVHYTLRLKTQFFEGIIASGEDELASPELEEKIEELTMLVVQHLRDKIGDSSSENPLGEESLPSEDETPL